MTRRVSRVQYNSQSGQQLSISVESPNVISKFGNEFPCAAVKAVTLRARSPVELRLLYIDKGVRKSKVVLYVIVVKVRVDYAFDISWFHTPPRAGRRSTAPKYHRQSRTLRRLIGNDLGRCRR